MRVLLITPGAPSKQHVNGGSTRMHRLYRRLIELGNEVTAVCVLPADGAASIAELEADGFTIRAHLRPRSRLRESLRAMALRPSLLLGFARRSMKELIASVFWVDVAEIVRSELSDGDHDVVVIESSFAAWWREEIETELPVVLVTHEVESIQLMSKGARVGGLAGLARYIDGGRVRRSERRYTPLFDSVITVSDLERRQLGSIVGEGRMPRSHVVGNGADLVPKSSVAQQPLGHRVLFTGTLAFPPNAVAADWLVHEVWPLVRAQLPRAQLDIVGARPPRAVRQLDRHVGVHVHADVPSTLPYFSRAAVCTLPMLEGGGTRLKLIDAFAARRAVVATSNGVAGVDCRHGREVLVADSAEDFARNIVHLLREPALRQRLAGYGRALAERHYGWELLGEQFADVLREVVAGGKVTPIKVVVSDPNV